MPSGPGQLSQVQAEAGSSAAAASATSTDVGFGEGKRCALATDATRAKRSRGPRVIAAKETFVQLVPSWPGSNTSSASVSF